MKRFFLIFFLSVITGVNGYSQSITHTVHFEVDQYTIDKSEQKMLMQFIASLEELDIDSISIAAHTDSDGSLEYNDRLSSRREDAVRDFMQENGVEDPICAEHLGEIKPLNTNSSEKEKRLNRRVEITVHTDKSDIRDLFKLLEQEKKRFCISSDRDTIIILDQGTILQFPKGAFKPGTAGCIEIRTKEVFKRSDMIMENLTTASDGRILESDGMIYIEAFDQNGTELQLERGKEVTIFLPTDSLRNDMYGFSGERDSHSYEMNWILNNSNSLLGFSPIVVTDCMSWWTSTMVSMDSTICAKCSFRDRVKRFGKPIVGIFNKGVRSANREFRRCQRRLRKTKKDQIIDYIPQTNLVENRNSPECDRLDSLFGVYGVSNISDLTLAMNKPFMDSLGITTMVELVAELNKIKVRETERRIESGEASINDLQYYMFNTGNLGWINCDAFSNVKGKRITMSTDLKVSNNQDCKAVFTKIRSVLPAQGDPYAFFNIPEGQPVVIVALKYFDGRAYLHLEKTKVQAKASPISFKKVTVEELKEELRKLDL